MSIIETLGLDEQVPVIKKGEELGTIVKQSPEVWKNKSKDRVIGVAAKPHVERGQP